MPASNIVSLEILQILPYTNFVPSDDILIDPRKVAGEPVLVIEMLDIERNLVGVMATHSPIVGIRTLPRTSILQ